MEPFLDDIRGEDRAKVEASLEFSLTVPGLQKFSSVHLSLGVQHWPLAQKSLDQAYAELVAKTLKLLRGSGYLEDEGRLP